MFPPSFFDELEDRLNLAVFDINEEHRMFKSVRWSGNGPNSSRSQTTRPPPERPKRVTTPEEIAKVETAVAALTIIEPERKPMSAIDRLKAKALVARNVAPDAIKRFEADLDGILAEKDAIENKRIASVSRHQEAIAGVKGELDGLKSAIDILSNG